MSNYHHKNRRLLGEGLALLSIILDVAGMILTSRRSDMAIAIALFIFALAAGIESLILMRRSYNQMHSAAVFGLLFAVCFIFLHIFLF